MSKYSDLIEATAERMLSLMQQGTIPGAGPGTTPTPRRTARSTGRGIQPRQVLSRLQHADPARGADGPWLQRQSLADLPAGRKHWGPSQARREGAADHLLGLQQDGQSQRRCRAVDRRRREERIPRAIGVRRHGVQCQPNGRHARAPPPFIMPESIRNLRLRELLDKHQPKLHHDGGNRAFYSVATDSIHVPKAGSFQDPISYASTVLHELAHWTGAKHRLGRDLTGRFGTEGMPRRNWWQSCPAFSFPSASGSGWGKNTKNSTPATCSLG